MISDTTTNLESVWRDCPYLSDLLQQPEALARTVSHLPPDNSARDIAAGLLNGRFRRVLLTGMGSSYWACRPLYLRLLEAGLTPVMAETSEVIHHERGWLEPQTLVVAVSQSGRSVEIVRLLEMARGAATVIGITNTADSPLAAASAFAVVTAAGPEHTVSCKTYLASLVALEWLGDALCGLSDPAVGEACAVVRPIRAYLERWPENVTELLRLTAGAQRFFLVGRGASVAAAGNGALILKESTHTHAEGMSSATFRHGPFEMLNSATFVLVFEGGSRSAELNRKLVGDIRAAGAMAELVSPEAAGVLRIPASPYRFRPLMEILPAEMMTLALAAAKGLEPGRFHLSSKVTVIE